MQNNYFKLWCNLAQMLKWWVIMDVVNVEQAIIAEKAWACAIMALERVPADIRKDWWVARMSNPKMIKEIKKAVSIPVMAKVRIWHFVEAQVLESLEIDFIDESEVLTPADPELHIDKTKFKIPFVCWARNLWEALRRISEWAVMIRTKWEAWTWNIVEAVRHAKQMINEIKKVKLMSENELVLYWKEIWASVELLRKVKKMWKLPVVNFAAWWVATPADSALMMQLWMEWVFVWSWIFKSSNPEKTAKAIVKAVTYFNDPKKIAEACEEMDGAMQWNEIEKLEVLMQKRWN